MNVFVSAPKNCGQTFEELMADLREEEEVMQTVEAAKGDDDCISDEERLPPATFVSGGLPSLGKRR
jgi:hypothetical protein